MALKTEQKEIHVLMVSFAALGHINPMLRLAKRLVSKGLHITFALSESARPYFLQSTNDAAAAAEGVSANSFAGIHIEFYADGLGPDHDRMSNMDLFMESLYKNAPINLSTIIQNHSPKFSCLINNPFVPWAARVASEHGLPCAMLWIQPCILYALYYRYYSNLNPFPALTSGSQNGDFLELPGLPLLEIEDLPSFLRQSNSFGSFPKLLSETFHNIKKIKWILANSFHELEKEMIESMSEVHPIWPVGPLVPSSLLGEDEELDISIDLQHSNSGCLEWLNQQQPSSVIYIAFGSVIEGSEKDMENIATALKKTSRPFLWVVKTSGTILRVFIEETKNQGLIVQWSPQTKVLAHPSVGCFLTHCGWSSLLETITAGVPVIAFPKWTDQPTNAKLVCDVLRVGVRLRPNKDGVVTSEEVEKCIEDVMGSEGYKKNAAELKRVARDAVTNDGLSCQNIQLFVDEILEMS